MNNRVLGIFAGLVSIALVAVLVLFYTTSQSLSETEDDLSAAQETATAQLSTSVAQADAAAATATTSFESGEQALQDAEDAAATQGAIAEATQTKAAEDLADSESAAATQQSNAEASQEALAATATSSFEEAATAQAHLEASATSAAEHAATQQADAQATQAALQADAQATQAALQADIEANQTQTANLSLTAIARETQQSEAIAGLENDLAAARADLQTAEDTQFALSSELANASIELQSVAATATAQASELTSLQATIESLNVPLPPTEVVVESTPTPGVVQSGNSPSKLFSFNQGWQAATDELLGAGLIPSGGKLLWELAVADSPIETSGEGGNNLILDQVDTSHTNVVLAADITPHFTGTFAQTGELELCRLAGRLAIRNDSIAESISAIIANDGYFFALDDFGDTDAEFVTFGDRDLGIASGQKYHVLMIVDGTEMTVYLDGRLVMDHAQVDNHPGEFASVGSLGVSDETRCTFENVWVYRLP